MLTQINEPIAVMVRYKQDGKKAVPTMMEWQNRLYRFSQFGFWHPFRQGRRLIHVFTVSDGINTFRLEFDTESLLWTLREISDGNP